MLLRSSKGIFSFDLAHLRTVLSRNTTTNNIVVVVNAAIGSGRLFPSVINLMEPRNL